VKQNHTDTIDGRQADVLERLDRESERRNPDRPMLARGNEVFEVAERSSATNHGGIGLIHRLARQLGLPKLIDEAVRVFKGPSPYTVSDYVLSIAYNVVAGGRMLDDLELRRQDAAYMDALGATRIPDPTTGGDFLRRFDRTQIDDLSEAIDVARVKVWKKDDSNCFRRAIIDVDETIDGTNGK